MTPKHPQPFPGAYLTDADGNTLDSAKVGRTVETFAGLSTDGSDYGPEAPHTVVHLEVNDWLAAWCDTILGEAVSGKPDGVETTIPLQNYPGWNRYGRIRNRIEEAGEKLHLCVPCQEVGTDTPVQRVGAIVDSYSVIVGDPAKVTAAGDLIADLVHYILANDDSATISGVFDAAERDVRAERAETEDKHQQDLPRAGAIDSPPSDVDTLREIEASLDAASCEDDELNGLIGLAQAQIERAVQIAECL